MKGIFGKNDKNEIKLVGVQGFVSTYFARKKNYKRGKKDATMTSTPFDPDDDDAEDIVKVLKKRRRQNRRRLFFSFLLLLVSLLFVRGPRKQPYCQTKSIENSPPFDCNEL